MQPFKAPENPRAKAHRLVGDLRTNGKNDKNPTPVSLKDQVARLTDVVEILLNERNAE